MSTKLFNGRGLPRIALIWLAGIVVTSLVLTPLLLGGPSSYQANNSIKEAKPDKAVQEAYGHLPLSFEPNTGQFDPQVQFMARGSGYELFLTPSEAVFSLKKGEDKKPQVDKFAPPIPETQPIDSQPPLVLRMKAIDSNPYPQLIGQDELPGKVNYFIGNDPNKWHTDIPTYSQVKYQGLYPGVDLVYYGNQGQLEYDFMVAPGADPDQIHLGYDGVEELRLNPLGELELQTKQGVVTQHPPLIYQEIEGQRQLIPGRYRLLDNKQVGFRLGDYNRARPLVIDPVLVYSTYLGGSGNDESTGVTVDSNHNVYVIGYTSSPNFPTYNPFQNNNNPVGTNFTDAFISKLNPTGSALVYSTYLGGSTNDFSSAITVDSSGNAYAVGGTNSINFPTHNPLQANMAGAGDIFLAKLTPTGNALTYSTYFGGTSLDFAASITLDPNTNVYISGYTLSTNFPTLNPFQASFGGIEDTFLTKVNADGSALIFSTYMGGSSSENGFAITLDSNLNIYITGTTDSTDFPTKNPFQNSSKGGGEIFISEFSPLGGLIYSTYIGGTGYDVSKGIRVDSNNNIYISGFTASTDFPIQNPFQASAKGSYDAIVLKLNPTGNSLIYSTYLGGSDNDTSIGIALDSGGNIVIVGSTLSLDFPTQNPFQTNNNGDSDIFVAKLSSNGNSLIYSTYFGGSNRDDARSFALDNDDNVYISGNTGSADFPTRNPFQANINQGSDAFITKISGIATCSFSVTNSTDDGSGTSCGTLSYALKQVTIYAAPVTITLPAQITFTGPMPVVTPTATVTLAGSCTDNNGRGTPETKIIAGSGAGSNALTLTNNMAVSGVAITGFSGYALNITGNNNTVSCSWLGRVDGTSATANGGGVRLAGSNNKLGLVNQPLSGNLISGNTGVGVQVESGSKGNTAYYNLIGYTADRSGPLRNGSGAVKVLAGGQLNFGPYNRLR